MPIIPPLLTYEYARSALVALNEKSVYALPVVLNLVKDGIMSTREEKDFYKFLVNHQNRTRSPISDQMVKEALVRVSMDTSEFNWELWILYLWTIQPRQVDAPELVSGIEPVLTPPNGMVQFQAISSIGQLGTNAMSALPILKPSLDDANYQAAFAAKKAIEQINDAGEQD